MLCSRCDSIRFLKVIDEVILCHECHSSGQFSSHRDTVTRGLKYGMVVYRELAQIRPEHFS